MITLYSCILVMCSAGCYALLVRTHERKQMVLPLVTLILACRRGWLDVDRKKKAASFPSLGKGVNFFRQCKSSSRSGPPSGSVPWCPGSSLDAFCGRTTSCCSSPIFPWSPRSSPAKKPHSIVAHKGKPKQVLSHVRLPHGPDGHAAKPPVQVQVADAVFLSVVAAAAALPVVLLVLVLLCLLEAAILCRAIAVKAAATVAVGVGGRPVVGVAVGGGRRGRGGGPGLVIAVPAGERVRWMRFSRPRASRRAGPCCHGGGKKVYLLVLALLREQPVSRAIFTPGAPIFSQLFFQAVVASLWTRTSRDRIRLRRLFTLAVQRDGDRQPL